MATFRTYAEVLSPHHPMMKNHKAASTWRPSRYRPSGIEQAMRAEPGVVLGDVLRQTAGAYETTTRLMPKFRQDIREIAELTSDDQLLRIAEQRFWGAWHWDRPGQKTSDRSAAPQR